MFGFLKHLAWFGQSPSRRKQAELIAPFFDHEFYLAANPDVAESGRDAIDHYIQFGWREGRDPSPHFSTSSYLAEHPHLAKSPTNPLYHFVSATSKRSSEDGEEGRGSEFLDLSDPIVTLVAEHLDVEFYCAKYPDVAQSGVEPAVHYCSQGWREGLDPTPGFSTTYYLLSNPDIRESGVNPFWHYLSAGKLEGRLTKQPGGWRYRLIAGQQPLTEAAKHWIRPDKRPTPLEKADLIEDMSDRLTKDRALLISIGHDDYRANPGGVQLCIESEEKLARSRDTDYLNIFPWQPLPFLAPEHSDPLVGLVLNGIDVGFALTSDAIEAAIAVSGHTRSCDIAVHHLAGHAPEQFIKLANALEPENSLIWLHDYFTLCTSFALQRNNAAPCDAPSIHSNACGICLYRDERESQSVRIRRFFESLDLTVVAPSEVALSFWESKTNLPTKSKIVLPHSTLEATRKTTVNSPDASQNVRIAFVGTPLNHKGWPVFVDLKHRLSSVDFEFFFFGMEKISEPNVRSIPVHARASDRDQMTRILADHDIDIVLHWADWRETFSFSAHEAIASGAFVVTTSHSGNVAAAVRKYDAGLVLDNVEDLYRAAESGELKELARAARKRRAATTMKVKHSSLSFEFVKKLASA